MLAMGMGTAVLGLIAGVITTVAGMGGGMVLLLALAALTDPLTALTLTAPALLLGNLHRLWLYRGWVSRDVALRLIGGAVPGALAGGLVATALPPWVLSTAMLAMAGLAGSRLLGLRIRAPLGAALPMGLLCGVVIATSGGAGVLVGPFLLARGLTGTTYVATAASIAAAMHAGRLVAYGLGGATDTSTLLGGLGLAVAIAAGNLLGDRLRRRLAEGQQGRVQHGVMALCVGLAVVGMW